MSFFDRFKKKVKVRKSKKIKKSVEKSVGTGQTLQAVKLAEKRQPESNDILIQQWAHTVKKLENHPLSQFKLINVSILEQLTDILTNIDNKLDKLNKLDDIIDILTKEKHQMQTIGLSTDNIDLVIAKLKGLSTRDKDALELLKGAGPVTAESFADKASLNRSTASTRLNKLHSFGLLKKSTDGKKIVFEIDKKD